MKSDHSFFETILFRIGLVSAGGLLIHLAFLLSGSIPVNNKLLNTVLMIAICSLGLYALVSAGLRRMPDYLRWFILATYVIEVVLQAVLWVQSSSPQTNITADSGLYTELASELFLHGQNPYTWDYGGVFDLFRQRAASTPVLNGSAESPFPYPALSFLLVTPFQLLGLPGVFSLSIVAHIAVLVLVFIATPRRWQPIVLLPTLVGLRYLGPDFTTFTLVGITDIVWVLAFIGMLAVWRHWNWRAILFGLAVSLKQSPALLAPFLLVYVGHEVPDKRIRHVARFVGLSAATFFLINGPFILWNPTAWFLGYTEPLRDNQVYLSQGGLSTLTQVGIVYLPKSFFLVAMMSVFGLLLIIYWRHYNELRDALWIFPGIAMWFSYRSLISYWMFWAFPMILVTTSRQPMVLPPTRRPSWKPTLVAIFGTLAIMITIGIVFALPSAPVQLKLQYPLFSTSGRIDRLTLSVSNHSNAVVTPRFFGQFIRTDMNSQLWTIEAGPPILQPGQTATYQLASERNDLTFFAHEAVQVVVTDAGGDYSLRGVLTIEPDRSYLWPDAIPNPEYTLWDTTLMKPLFWSIVGQGSIEPTSFQNRNAVRLIASEAPGKPLRIALSNLILFPDAPFGIWLNPPASDPELAYGLEILTSEQRRLWILFGPRTYTGPVDDDTHVLYYHAPAGAWTYQEIDLRAAFTEAGWPLPPLRPTLVMDIPMDARQVELHLFFLSQDPGIKAATFGPIQQGDYRLPPNRLMAETFEDPAGYYQRLAESYLNERNTTQALEAYQRALDFAPGNADILARIARLNQQLDEVEP